MEVGNEKIQLAQDQVLAMRCDGHSSELRGATKCCGSRRRLPKAALLTVLCLSAVLPFLQTACYANTAAVLMCRWRRQRPSHIVLNIGRSAVDFVLCPVRDGWNILSLCQ
jgi:hypothetical protein